MMNDEFNEYMKQNIITAVLRKANFHSVYICRLMKNQSCKKRSRRITDSKFFLSWQVAHGVLRIRNVVHIIEFSLH